MYLYYKRLGNEMIVKKPHDDDLLVTASLFKMVEDFVFAMSTLSMKDLG